MAVDEFVVAYHRLNGRDGQCSSFQDEGSVTVRAGREEETNTANLYLQAYSVYSCTVTARKGGGVFYNDTRFNITTNSTGMYETLTPISACMQWRSQRGGFWGLSPPLCQQLCTYGILLTRYKFTRYQRSLALSLALYPHMLKLVDILS